MGKAETSVGILGAKTPLTPIKIGQNNLVEFNRQLHGNSSPTQML